MAENNSLDKAVNLGQLKMAHEATGQRLSALEQAMVSIRNTADSALQPTTTYTANGQQYTAAQLLQAVAELMGKNLVTT